MRPTVPRRAAAGSAKSSFQSMGRLPTAGRRKCENRQRRRAALVVSFICVRRTPQVAAAAKRNDKIK